MNDRVVTLFRAESSAEAHVVRGLLEAEGIDAFVSDDVAVGALSYIGSALGGVKLNVRQADYERACAVLASIQDRADPGGGTGVPHATPNSDWHCGQCGERVPWEFDVCWSCGTPAPDEKVPVADAEGAERTLAGPRFAQGDGNALSGLPASDFRDPAVAKKIGAQGSGAVAKCSVCGIERPEEVDYCPACGAAVDGPVNPYRYTGGAGEVVVDDPPLPAASEEVERMVARAYRASVIGIVLCPPLICTYSVYLLLYAAVQGGELTRSGERKFYAALLLNILIGCPLAVVSLLFVVGPLLSYSLR